jgi:Tol biopolymer transport system component
MISPDGKWMAYVSDESGQNEVYVRAYPQGDARYQISLGGATEPVWDRDGNQLYYRQGSTLMVAALASSSTALRATRRDSLFAGSFRQNPRWTAYDVFPDGNRFVLVKPGKSTIQPIVVLNWLEALRRRQTAQ